MFLLTSVEDIVLKQPILTLIIMIFFLYAFLKLFLAVLRKCGLVAIELGCDYSWYNLFSLFNI